jgi:adenylate cyclase
MANVPRLQVIIRLGAGIIAGLIFTALFNLHWGADHLAGLTLLAANRKPAEPVIVQIDSRSLQTYGRWPWNRRRLALLTAKIAQNQPKAIGIDILLSEKSSDDDQLLTTLKKYPFICLPETLNLKLSQSIFHRRIVRGKNEAPAEALKEAAGATGFIDLTPQFNDKVRLMFLKYHSRKSFAAAVTQIAYPEFRSNHQSLFLKIACRPGDFASFSASEIIEASSMPQLRGKIVLIGLTAHGISDWHMTINPLIGKIPGVYLHAYAIANLLQWGGLTDIPFSWQFLGMLLICLATAFLPFKRIVGVWPLVLLGNFIISFIFYQNGLWMSPYVIGISVAGLTLTGWLQEQRIFQKILKKYIAPQVINEVLSNPKAAHDGAERVVTVLFADLRGFTRIAETLSPQALTALLNRHLEIMAEAIKTHGGIIDKYTGDGIMAFFDSSCNENSHSLNAFKAAVTIQAAIKQQAEMSVGIGIATGTAMVGEIGPFYRKNYTIIGDTVNVAARLEQIAKAGEIFLNEATARELNLQVRLNPLTLEGRIQPIKAICLTGQEIDDYSQFLSTKEN